MFWLAAVKCEERRALMSAFAESMRVTSAFAGAWRPLSQGALNQHLLEHEQVSKGVKRKGKRDLLRSKRSLLRKEEAWNYLALSSTCNLELSSITKHYTIKGPLTWLDLRAPWLKGLHACQALQSITRAVTWHGYLRCANDSSESRALLAFYWVSFPFVLSLFWH